MASKLLRHPEGIPISVLSWSVQCEFEQNGTVISCTRKKEEKIKQKPDQKVLNISSNLGLIRSFEETSVYSRREGCGLRVTWPVSESSHPEAHFTA